MEKELIFSKDYEEVLRNIGREYFISTVKFVTDISAWTKEHNLDLHEPHQPMKLVSETDKTLGIVIQSEIPVTMMNDVITNLHVRWSLKDNVSDPSEKLNSDKKRLVFAFLKEYARSLNGIGDDEFSEDTWAVTTMERLGFFKE